jgi:branched-chain amino acid transport system permease protein
MIGGIGSFLGPVLGTAIFQLIEELASRYTEHVELVIGLLLVVVIMYAPMGALGVAKQLRQKWRRQSTPTGALQKSP